MRGTQSIERAVVLLKELAARGTFGWRLSDLAAHCNLDKGTAHRILTCLQRERLVQRRESDRHFLPGPLLFELSLTLPPLTEFQAACQAPLERVARRTRGVAFLYLRSGSDFVCAARVGPTSLKGLTIQVGTRRPLVSSSGGVAILLALPEEESDRIVVENMKRLERFSATRKKSIEKMIRRSQAHGFAINLGDVVPGIHSFAIAIQDAKGAPFASLTVSAAAEDFPAAEAAKVMAVLEEERTQIGKRLRDLYGG
jgi:DNA-binding IclR family transcriptional regulator